MNNPIEVFENLYGICKLSLKDCYYYGRGLDTVDVVVLAFLAFVVLFLLLRIVYFLFKDTEIY
jgi:energy-converting hydrogenase Eha subunit F